MQRKRAGMAAAALALLLIAGAGAVVLMVRRGPDAGPFLSPQDRDPSASGVEGPGVQPASVPAGEAATDAERTVADAPPPGAWAGPGGEARLTGRVHNARTGRPVGAARVRLDLEGGPSFAEGVTVPGPELRLVLEKP